MISTFGPLHNRIMPRLAGLGRPDHIALTVDDGPAPLSTPHFLRLLAERRVAATFFPPGRQARRSPGMVRGIAAAGHETGIHGRLHRSLLLGPRATYDDFARARDSVAGITGQQPTLFRPPYDVMSAAAHLATRRLALTPALWTCWDEDWTAHATAQSVHRTVTSGLAGGGTAPFSTTSTARPPPAPGARLRARCPSSSAAASNAAAESARCGITGWPHLPD
ncbi:polysaccharide deacetylase family protein [Streptomyces sp. NPDC048324]|uniref:polysaccharide deacetylase family protein n=1 Tax=Streptomyces sp. NPDC048324 TaxID=3157205 RepID=UPI00342BBD82